jgi:hypothetical protein
MSATHQGMAYDGDTGTSLHFYQLLVHLTDREAASYSTTLPTAKIKYHQ